MMSVALSMTLVLFTVKNMHQENPRRLSTSRGLSFFLPLQKGKYVDIHFLTEVT